MSMIVEKHQLILFLIILNKRVLRLNTMTPFVAQWQCERVEEVADIDEWADVLILVTDHSVYQELTVSSAILNTRS